MTHHGEISFVVPRAACTPVARRLVPWLTALIIGISYYLTEASVQGQDRDSVVTITLAGEVAVDTIVIDIEQLAELRGGSNELRNRIARLDVAELKAGVRTKYLTSDHVRFRLLIAGIDPEQFRIAGPKLIHVTESDNPISRRRIAAAAEATLRQAYSDNGDIAITPLRGIPAPQVDFEPTDRVRLEAKLADAAPTGGITRVNVAVYVNQRKRDVIPVSFEVAAVRKQPNRIDQNLLSASYVGTNGAAKDLRTVLVRPRDLVKIVAQVGPARIEAGGEALQEGRLGDVIRVRNVESNRIVQGRVDEGGIVLIDY